MVISSRKIGTLANGEVGGTDHRCDKQSKLGLIEDSTVLKFLRNLVPKVWRQEVVSLESDSTIGMGGEGGLLKKMGS